MDGTACWEKGSNRTEMWNNTRNCDEEEVKVVPGNWVSNQIYAYIDRFAAASWRAVVGGMPGAGGQCSSPTGPHVNDLNLDIIASRKCHALANQGSRMLGIWRRRNGVRRTSAIVRSDLPVKACATWSRPGLLLV